MLKLMQSVEEFLDRDENELAISANIYRGDLDLNTLRDSLKDKALLLMETNIARL